MATSTAVCSVCDLQHRRAETTHWCIECEEPMCLDCKKHHNVLKATRNHKTISITDYKLLPSVVIDIKQHCIYHNEMYQLYCIKHERPICNKCVKDHGKCGEILSLDELVKDIKTSESFVHQEQSLDDLNDNIKVIRKDREYNIESITDQKKKIIAKVCHLKNQTIRHINKLEEEFIKEIDQMECTCSDPIRSIVSSLQDKEKYFQQIKSDVQNTKKYASNLQAFLHMREIQGKTTECEKHLNSIIENKSHQKITIESAIDTKIHDILTVARFGSIKVKKSPSSSIVLNKRKEKQVQIRVPKAKELIQDVKVELKRELNTGCEYSYGCCITTQGEFLVTNSEEYNEKIIIITADGEVKHDCPLAEPYIAFDVVCLDDFTVAASTGLSTTKRGISIFDFKKKIVKQFIRLPGKPFGIAYDGKSLICCVLDNDLHVISCSDYSTTTIPNTTQSWMSYVSTHADKIFLANPLKRKITCCLYSGAPVWEFRDDNVLNNFQGITSDNKGNVFVVGKNSCNVVVISADGKQCKQILTEEDGLDDPKAIFFDKVRNQLLVTNYQHLAYVYDVYYF